MPPLGLSASCGSQSFGVGGGNLGPHPWLLLGEMLEKGGNRARSCGLTHASRPKPGGGGVVAGHHDRGRGFCGTPASLFSHTMPLF